MSTVPVFAPDGSLGDIPAENLVAAVKAGYKPGVTMKSQDGSTGVIPADRVPDAAKGGLQIVPLKEQETQHPGFWHALGSDLMAMLPDFKNAKVNPYGDEQPLPGRVVAGVRQAEMEDKQQAADDAARKAAGYSDTYTALAPVAEGLGVNVHGMEESAKEGDRAGVAGHAAAVPTVMAATAGVAKGAGVVADVAEHPAFKSALAKVKQLTPKQAAQAAARAGSVVLDNDVTGVFSPRAKNVGRILTRTADALEDKPKATGATIERDATLDKRNIPEYAGEGEEKPGAPVERDATLDQRNIPEFAGEEKPPLVDMTDKLAGELAKQRGATNFTAGDRLHAKSLLQESLKSSTTDVVDSVIPAGKSYGPNLATKSRVEFYLERGDVANAEKSLDAGAKQADADYQPFYRDPKPVPSTNEIRARVQAEAKAPKLGTRADLMDDKAVDQEWQWQLERHGWSAASEARREFIARNSTGMTKGELARKFAAERSGTAAQSAAAPASATPADDLTSILQKSLEQARKKKAQ